MGRIIVRYLGGGLSMLSTDKLLKTMPSVPTENWEFAPLLGYISS